LHLENVVDANFVRRRGGPAIAAADRVVVFALPRVPVL
jgi:hypothetical protein